MPTVKNGDQTISYRETGEGAPLLLIMGLGYTAQMWHRIEGELAKHYCLLIFDNRGLGDTPAAKEPFTLVDMASDAVAVMDAAGVERAHVMGISMGGYIAQELVLNFPERVDHLILGCTGPGGEVAVPPKQSVLDLLVSRASMDAEEAMWAMAPNVYASSTPQSVIEADFALRLKQYPTEEAYLAQFGAIMNWSGTGDRLANIKTPTLVIHGEEDALVPFENGQYLAANIPGAQHCWMPQASHIFFSDQVLDSIAAVTGFLPKT